MSAPDKDDAGVYGLAGKASIKLQKKTCFIRVRHVESDIVSLWSNTKKVGKK